MSLGQIKRALCAGLMKKPREDLTFIEVDLMFLLVMDPDVQKVLEGNKNAD